MTDSESTVDKLKGKAKEMGGKATGNDRMQAEGKTDQTKAKAEETAAKAKDKMKGIKDSLGKKKDGDARG
ncbi:CsbD family protein [Streptomyces sp. NPDC058657]|uniref:CsbD family protein n=1 Tax=unclassified Streptomyces TaxID=2593676 RepID=UPI003652F730